MNNKNYEFTGETMVTDSGVTLRRIRATKDLPHHGVKAGDIGGWIEKESNLSGEAWVCGSAKVFGDAKVYGSARVQGFAKVYGTARVLGGAILSHAAEVSDTALVHGEAWVYESAWVHGNARVCSNARVCGEARVFDEAWVFGEARVFDEAWVFGEARVFDEAWVHGNARVFGEACVYNNARLTSSNHHLTSTVFASDCFNATLVRTNGGGSFLTVGCWKGTLEDFEAMIRSDEWVKATSEQIEVRRPELLAFVEMCKARIATW